jgi:hypothetical protein
MRVKTLKEAKCDTVAELIDFLTGIDGETPLQCHCADFVKVSHKCNLDDDSDTWVELDS